MTERDEIITDLMIVAKATCQAFFKTGEFELIIPAWIRSFKQFKLKHVQDAFDNWIETEEYFPKLPQIRKIIISLRNEDPEHIKFLNELSCHCGGCLQQKKCFFK